MSGQRLKLTAVYENDQLDTTTVTAGRCDPKLRVSQPPLPKLSELTATARWLGQDVANPAGPGDVHVVHLGAAGLACDRRGGAQQLAARRLDLPPERPRGRGRRRVG